MAYFSVFQQFDNLDREILDIKTEAQKQEVIRKIFKLIWVSEHRVNYLRTLSCKKDIRKYQKCIDKLIDTVRDLNELIL
jgi:hypothetical protein